MDKRGFIEYINTVSPSKSGKVVSYIKAIEQLDRLFVEEDLFGLNHISLFRINDVQLLANIRQFILEEGKKLKQSSPNFFDSHPSVPKSYFRDYFCTAALAILIEYACYEQEVIDANEIVARETDAKNVSVKLASHFDVTKEGTDELTLTKQRKGQAYFNRMIMANYHQRCCITGLNIPCVLQACHIVGWREDKQNRLNPENGLCMSATYHLAFDKHLFSLDEDFRIFLSTSIQDYFTVQITRDYFKNYEGKRIAMPETFKPNQSFLDKHRALIV